MKRLFRFLIMLSAITLLLVMMAVPVGAIQNGTNDDDGHPYVCVVLFYDDNFEFIWRTSGELIAPNIVLTAGHGTLYDAESETDVPHACVWFDSNLNPNDTQTMPYEVTLYPNYGEGTSYTGTPVTYPGYNGMYNDVGVVILDEVPAGITPVELPTAGLADTLDMRTSVDIVGYGVQWQKRGVPDFFGFPPGFYPPPPYTSWTWNHQRQYATAELIQSENILGSQFLMVSANPSKGKGGTTFGDSGGPIILEGGSDIVLGINSFVYNYNCSGVTYAQRIDIPDILTWLADPS